MIAEETGHEPDEVHEFLKLQFLKKNLDKLGDVAKSSTELNTLEFEEYAEKCRRWASVFLNLNIPEPNESENRI
jgi:hypothetical protein